MATILLTSTGLSVPAVQAAFESEAKTIDRSAKVVMITTAARQRENNFYVQASYKELQAQGFLNIQFLDLLTEPADVLKQAKIIYVCGGNTFRLLKALRDSGADQIIKDFCEHHDGMYIGVSAGSLVICQSITSAVGHDANEVEMSDLTGLGLVPYVLLVHYTSNDEEELRTIQQNFPNVRTLTDEQAVLHNGMHERWI